MIRGLVLAGGKSSRFGSDKALALYEGETFLSRAARILTKLKLELVIAVRENVSYSVAGGTLLEDCYHEKGPLGGIYTAMSCFKNTAFLVMTCDMPALTADVLKELLLQHDASQQITFFETSGEWKHPFPGIYEPSLLELIRETVKRGDDLSMAGLLKAEATVRAIGWTASQNVFLNVNTPQDLIYQSS